MEGEYELTFEGFTCPTPLVNDFTPDQFAEMVSTFKRYDADGSETIGLDEMAQLLEDLDMGHAIEKATELMSLIDTDGSGELDFSEFCYFFSRLVRGDTALRGFNAVAEALNETPVSST
jgi:Ca2+-binding EF-hand superfamily protein